tara:strand:- start:675 stop:956 length:282 start_codon:yes stop_codon:yes gene_type:complete
MAEGVAFSEPVLPELMPSVETLMEINPFAYPLHDYVAERGEVVHSDLIDFLREPDQMGGKSIGDRDYQEAIDSARNSGLIKCDEREGNLFYSI